MSFGFSVGDFLAVASLIEQTICALREAGGSSSQYQRLTLELHALGRTLQEVDHLEAVRGLEATIEAIKATALSCQLPLQEFLERIKKYDESLALGRTAGIMKDVLHKVRWVTSKKEEAALHLQAQIAAYLGGINLLLGLYQIKLNAIAEERARRRFQSLQVTLSNMQLQTQKVEGDITKLRQQIVEETSIVRREVEQSFQETSEAVQSLQRRCVSTVQGLVRKAGTLSQITFQTYYKVSEIYKMLSSMQSTPASPDTRHTWFQEPMRLEDAYGRIWPIPAEYDYPMVEGLLRGKFLHGRGKQFVEENQWQLFDASNSQKVFSRERWEPIPGMKITMALILQSSYYRMCCPRMDCHSEMYTNAPGGGKKCTECGAWFDSVSGTPAFIEEIEDLTDGDGNDDEVDGLETNPDSEDGETEANSEREVWTLILLEDLRLLKNAKLRQIGASREIEYDHPFVIQLSPDGPSLNATRTRGESTTT